MKPFLSHPDQMDWCASPVRPDVPPHGGKALRAQLLHAHAAGLYGDWQRRGFITGHQSGC
jgi:hypothetical protein